MNRWWRIASYVALAALPAMIPVIFILAYGVNTPVLDQWDAAGSLFVKAHLGQLSIFDFTAQHNEHRILFPRIAFFVLGALTHWNTLAEMFFEWLVICGTSAGVLWLCRRDADSLDGSILFRWFVCNLLIFSQGQWENLLSGMGLCNAMPMAWIIAAIVMATSGPISWTKLLITIGLLSAATFTCGTGILGWAMVMPLLAWSRSWAQLRAKAWMIVAFVGSLVVNVSLYFIGFNRPDAAAGAQAYSASLWQRIDYALVFCGSPFAVSNGFEFQTASRIFGSAMLLLAAGCAVYFLFIWLGRKDYELGCKMLVWLALAGSAVASAAIASLYRAGYGAEQAFSSRYITFALWLPVALVNLIPIVCSDLSRRASECGWKLDRLLAQAPAALMGAMILLDAISIPPATYGAARTESARRRGRALLQLIQVTGENPQFTQVYATYPVLYERATVLNSMGYLHPPVITDRNALHIEDATPFEKSGQPYGSLEKFGPLSGAPDKLVAIGWAVCPRRGQVADAVFLTYEDQNGQPMIFAVANMGIRRDEIAHQQGNNVEYVLCGWGTSFPVSSLPNYLKTIKISAWMLDADTGKAVKLEGEGVATR